MQSASTFQTRTGVIGYKNQFGTSVRVWVTRLRSVKAGWANTLSEALMHIIRTQQTHTPAETLEHKRYGQEVVGSELAGATRPLTATGTIGATNIGRR
jgi:hypothetical protein